MKLRNFGPARAIDHIVIERIGRDIAIFDHAHRMPLAVGYGTVVAAARDADRAALLLSRANAVRKRIVGDGMVELRGRLVVPRTPTRAAVHRDDRALIADDQNNVAVVGIDPEILV